MLHYTEERNRGRYIMTQDIQQKIDSHAAWLREIMGLPFEQNNLSVDDMINIVNRLNGTVEFFTGGGQYERVEKVSDESFAIWINETNAPARQKLSIAHELGHLFIDMQYRTDAWAAVEVGASYERDGSGPFEVAANVFATAFLMPKEQYLQIAESTSDENFYYPQEIAKEFRIPEDVAHERGRALGLWT